MIELKDVSKIYPRKGQDPVVALDDLSLSISEGTIHGIVGESGAGKSTLIRCLTALEQPTEGHILVDGEDLTQLQGNALRAARRRIGMVFQGANLFEARTAFENIAYPLKVAKISKAQRTEKVQRLLDLVGLADRGNSYPSQLSGGQRQRVGIARALAADPAVLLADEPTSALDMETTDSILDLLKDVRDRTGVTVIVITHEMSVVRKICDSATLLDQGKIVETGKLTDIITTPTSALARKLIPLPEIDLATIGNQGVVDLYFTSRPGEPTGSRVMTQVAELGADIAAGVFETIGEIQIGRLALTVAPNTATNISATLRDQGLHAEVRVA
ncbi:MAG: ATP-binding cassette domain-containing protein [Actinomycetaceae bacterium]|nr:ATP-binding cassette domain-containing protein [Actinomycetaceae bacterium]